MVGFSLADLIDASGWSPASTSIVAGDGLSSGYTTVSWLTGAGKGATITPNAGDTGKTLFIPNAGNRNRSDGVVYAYGSWGYSWSAEEHPSSTSYAWYISFYSSYISGSISSSGKLEAKAIRCVRS